MFTLAELSLFLSLSIAFFLSFSISEDVAHTKKIIVRYLFIIGFQRQQNVVSLRRLNSINPTPTVTDAAPGGGRGDVQRLLRSLKSHQNTTQQTHTLTHTEQT